MCDLDELWERTQKIFPILSQELKVPTYKDEDFDKVIVDLNSFEIAEGIYETIFMEIEEILRKDIVPKFWEHFKPKDDSESGFSKFQDVVTELEKTYRLFLEILDIAKLLRIKSKFQSEGNIKRNELEYFNDCFRSTMLSQLPGNFNDIVHSFYNTSFKVFANSHQSMDDEDIDEDLIGLKCNGCETDTENCKCQELINAFNKTNEHLTNMGLLDRLAGFTLTSLIQDRIYTHVRETCQGIFDKSHMQELEQWLKSVVFNWLTRIYNRGSLNIDYESKKIEGLIIDFEVKLSFYAWESYAKIIIEQFFNIIIDFPDSLPAIDDLQVCLNKTDLQQYLVNTLKESLENRLLHPGVNTMDILTGYVAAIKAIRHLDDSGVMLETVTEPVKEYLRRRPDTVRRVVTGLTEEGPTDLAEELARSETLKENVEISNNDEMANWENWQPDLVDVNSCLKTVKKSRSADIISMVVDIYGSKELFVNEYRSLLADRLLTQLDFNPEKEIRNLELLKLRFGETLLHNCEVMLKDISDSKRINTHIQSDINYSNKTFEISSLILSAQYWPTFNKETLELPEEIQEEFKKFTKSYEAYKGNRTLNWRNVTGRMNIEIQLTNRTLEMSVTPTQAVIIYHFQNKNEWTLDELSSTMKVPASVLRKRIGFWQTNGLLKESKTDCYTLVEESDEKPMDEVHTSAYSVDEEESESAMASASDQREEELQVFWSYIVGMLTNLDSLPIERIHQMLKMFASHGPGIEFSQDELKNFLQRKVREHKLMFTGGVYQLAK